MCGRYAATADPAALAAELDEWERESGVGAGEVSIDEPDADAPPSYNVAPTTQILTVVRRHDDSSDDAPVHTRIRRMRWGLIPHWAKAAEPGVPAKGRPLFNARADTAATTASFRVSLAHKRCLIPMDGWYEWLTEPSPDAPAKGKGKAVKVPFYMTPLDGSRLYAAGLWSVWRDKAAGDSAKPLLSCTILTTDAIGDTARIHDRMPLVLPRRSWAQWLDPDRPAPQRLLDAADPDLVAGLDVRQVATAVNNVRNNTPDLTDRVDDLRP
ncbi:MAG: SOS response-associated peptidase [Mycobacteriaceae bacterium]|nr:SOS response-associated peptidase [Mycobacteriaceae bacterium]